MCYGHGPDRPAVTFTPLERFEALVLSQQPAAVPWQPVTDYSDAARDAVEGPHAAIIAEMFRPSLVYDVGCGPGHLVRLLKVRGIEVLGFDKAYDADARLDIAAPLPQVEPLQAELVICREVLEHLTVREIRKAVTNLCALSWRFVYVTTRFNQRPADLLDVQTSDDLDPTHISLLPQDLLRALFVLEGFRRRADLEQALDWMRKGRVLVYERT
jgi:SAM-dependent methyltransferase